MGNTGAAAGEQPDFPIIQLDAMGVPDIRPGPAEILGILTRSAAEFFLRVGYVLIVLRKMGMKHNLLVTSQQSRIAHQVPADREGRTGCDADADHGAVAGIVEGTEQQWVESYFEAR